jgi:hypothetical protein
MNYRLVFDCSSWKFEDMRGRKDLISVETNSTLLLSLIMAYNGGTVETRLSYPLFPGFVDHAELKEAMKEIVGEDFFDLSLIFFPFDFMVLLLLEENRWDCLPFFHGHCLSEPVVERLVGTRHVKEVAALIRNQKLIGAH